MSDTTSTSGGFGAWLLDPKRRGALLVTPAIVVLFVMNIFPLLWSFGLSFFNYRASSQRVPSFQGLENYADILTDEKAWERFQTTAIIVGSSVLLQLIVGFLLALLFAKEFPLRRIVLMLVLTPMMLSFVSVGVFFKLFYEPTFGIVSYVMNSFTAVSEAVQLEQAADDSSTEAREANQRSDNYTVMSVLFATVLFFAAISTKLESPRNQTVVLGLAIVGLLLGCALLATFPVEI